MPNFELRTPVAFIIFNRPGQTERVFAEIARAKPPKLLVIADGPRDGFEGESEKCFETRSIIKKIDWDCEVLTNFSEINLGCKVRVSTGINWVFDQVEEAIILEDDCLPNPTFFRYCQELLEFYRYDKRVGMISGDNFQFGEKRGNASYYFSKYVHIWGWASWRRAWMLYDSQINSWPQFRDEGLLRNFVTGQSEYLYWLKAFNGVHQGVIDTWDYQWVYTSWSNGMLSIMPNVNLISNIGFGENATHTKGVSELANMKVLPIEFPLSHPSFFIIDESADTKTGINHYSNSLIRMVFRKFILLLSIRDWKTFLHEISNGFKKIRTLIK
jgi:hypothetical protein